MIFSRDKQRLEARRLETLEYLEKIKENYPITTNPSFASEEERTNALLTIRSHLTSLVEEGVLDKEAEDAYRAMQKQCFEGDNPVIAYRGAGKEVKNRRFTFGDMEVIEYALKTAVEDLRRKQYQGLLGACFR